MSDTPWADCCDYCALVDGIKGKEMEACGRSTTRCKSDSCDRCKACGDFILGAGFTNAYNLARKRATIRPQPRDRKLFACSQGRLF